MIPITNLTKSISVLVFATILSRITGVLRESAVAYRFGISEEVDAYVIAMLIPIMFAASSKNVIENTFIPVYSYYRDKQDVRQFLSGLMAWIALGLLVITGLFYFNAPFIASLIAPGFGEATYEIASDLIKIIVFGVFFIGLYSLMAGFYHSHNRFFAPQIVYALQNLTIIATIFLMVERNVIMLAYGSLVGISLLFFGLLPGAVKMGFKLEKPNLKHQSIKEVAVLIPPILIGSTIWEIKTIIDNAFASLLVSGSVSALNYANRLIQAPIGLFIMSVVTVLLPTLSELVKDQELQAFKAKILQFLNAIVFFTLPMVVAIFVLSDYIIYIIYERGAFGAGDTEFTAVALMFFSIGLVTVGLKQLFSYCFYAMKDTKTPMLVNMIIFFINVGLNYLLMQVWAHGGIAFATGISAGIGALILFILLHRKLAFEPAARRASMINLGKILSASLVMLASMYNLEALLHFGPAFWGQLLALVALSAIGTLIFLLVCFILKVKELVMVKNVILSWYDSIGQGS